jgi:tetratricopeptide (TPR) repeat protein
MKYVILSLKSQPRNVERLLLKANLHKKEDKYEQAIKTYKEILDIQPYNTEAFDNVRSIEKRVGNQ